MAATATASRSEAASTAVAFRGRTASRRSSREEAREPEEGEQEEVREEAEDDEDINEGGTRSPLTQGREGLERKAQFSPRLSQQQVLGGVSHVGAREPA